MTGKATPGATSEATPEANPGEKPEATRQGGGHGAEDRAAIEALVFAYAERLDAGDLAGVGALFEAGGYGAEAGPLVSGAAAVEAVLRDFVILHEDGTPRTKHVTTNLVIELEEDGDRAAARSYFTVFQALPGEEPHAIALGRYRDRFTRGPAGWRFAERRAAVDLAGDLSRHLRHPTPAS